MQSSAYFLLIIFLPYSSTLKMEAVSFSEISVNVCRATLHHILEDITFHNHRYESLYPSGMNSVAVLHQGDFGAQVLHRNLCLWSPCGGRYTSNTKRVTWERHANESVSLF
jgi:hypothetical protein